MELGSFGGDGRGQSEIIGSALIVIIVLVGTTAVVVLGSTAVDDAQRSSDLQRAEQTMTLFDSRAAMVALGDSSSQSITLSSGGSGSYAVHPDEGWLRITHINYSGTDDEEIYNASLGVVTYRNDDTEVAYQGGGVWRKGDAGVARMVSPPEFHYRGSTLTLPVIRVDGSGSAAGSPTVTLRRQLAARHIYPNPSSTYGNGEHFANPATNGSVNVTVQSEYYEGWAQYFRSRTAGRVTLDHDNETATVQLITVGNVGDFDMPEEGESLTVRGLEGNGHSLDDFSFRLIGEQGDKDDLDSLQWSMFAEEGNKQLELYLKGMGNHRVKAVIYYSDDSGQHYHGWKNDSAFEVKEADIDGDGDNESYVDIDFTGDTPMNYTKLQKDDTNVFEPQKGEVVTSATWDQHPLEEVYHNSDSTASESDPVVFSPDDNTRIDNATNHYFELMGTEFDLTVKDAQSNGKGAVNEGPSEGRIMYPGADKFITYLHVTENEMRVALG